MSDIATTQNFYNFADNTLVNQSILDVFVLQDLLSQEDANRLRTKLKTNRQIEDFLIKSKVVTRDTINKAYSIILKLPYVELKSVQISQELKDLIPLALVKKYGIVPFGKDDNLIRLAVSRPADMLANFKSGLSKLIEDKKLDLELFITGESDFFSAQKQYTGRGGLLLSKGSLPIVYLRNHPISSVYLKKFPVEFIEKYRVVAFGQNQRGAYLIAAQQPDSPVTIKILDFLQKENNVKIETFATSSDDIDYVLGLLKTRDAYIGEPEEPIAPRLERPAGSSMSLKSILDTWVDSQEPELTIDQPDKMGATEAEINAKTAENEASEKAPVEAKPQEVETEKKTITKLTPEIEQPTAEKSGELPTSGFDNDDLGSLIEDDITDTATLQKIASEGFAPKVVAAIINFALNSRSSDVHIEPEAKSLRVRCRVDGVLKDILKLPTKFLPSIVSRIKILSKLKIDESRIPQDGRFDVSFKHHEVDVRVSTLPTVHGEKVVMRILDKSQGILSLEDLGMQGSAFEETSKAIVKPFGIILATGPTGSGKSTTLYAILNRISQPGVNIVTLEDPVEYEIPGVNQCQIKPEIGFTFANGLRSILRQDPNIIMVGEIRDAETAGMATHAALTGHLVLSTLHTNDAAGALPRLINMGVEPFLITSSINLVVAQRLVRRICPKCKEEMKTPVKLMDELKAEIAKISPNNLKDRARIPSELKLYYGKGCSECDHGYRGRIGIYEVMVINPEIEDLAVQKKTSNEIKEAALKSGMITMKQDGILKAFNGLTTIDEVFQAVINS